MDYFTIFGNYVRFSINFHNGLRLNLKINLRVFEGTFFPSSEENFANFSYSLFRIRWRKTRGGMRGIGWIKGKLEAEERERRGVKDAAYRKESKFTITAHRIGAVIFWETNPLLLFLLYFQRTATRPVPRMEKTGFHVLRQDETSFDPELAHSRLSY